MSDIWGQDIALDASGQARVAANGELVLTEGVETGVQDVRIRLSTYLGTLFYDKTFGCLLPDWFYEESTDSSRCALFRACDADGGRPARHSGQRLRLHPQVG